MTPESRIEMLEARRWFVERREEPQDASGFAIIVAEHMRCKRMMFYGSS